MTSLLGIHPDGSYDVLPHWESIRTTHGSGLGVVDNIEVKSVEGAMDVTPYDRLAVYEAPRLHGPYDIRGLTKSREAREVIVNGVSNYYWEPRIAAQSLSTGVRIGDAVASVAAAHRLVEPFRTWWADDDFFEYSVTQLVIGIRSARTFAELVSFVETWGFTAYSQHDTRVNEVDASRIRQDPAIVLRSRYPFIGTRVVYQTATYPEDEPNARLSNIKLELLPQVVAPAVVPSSVYDVAVADWANRPGRFQERRIETITLNFGFAEDYSYGAEGSPGPDGQPTLYLDPEDGDDISGYTRRLKRWEMQNESLTVTVMVRGDEGNHIVPHQIVKLPLNEGEDWRVVSVAHNWNAGDYWRDLHMALWQGFAYTYPETPGPVDD